MSKESSHTKEKTTIGRSSSSEVKKPAEKELSSSTFVNQAAIRWHESRKKWVDTKQSQQQQRMERDSIIRVEWHLKKGEVLLFIFYIAIRFGFYQLPITFVDACDVTGRRW
ncbi:hypothetical protein SDJN02_21436 [Cucurbita argyrosperma subsp. argyrosperma]|nr:hypothetical protein SDJN02_21436 [Cucurbita argyrosperma subsp. argyrosperma]